MSVNILVTGTLNTFLEARLSVIASLPLLPPAAPSPPSASSSSDQSVGPTLDQLATSAVSSLDSLTVTDSPFSANPAASVHVAGHVTGLGESPSIALAQSRGLTPPSPAVLDYLRQAPAGHHRSYVEALHATPYTFMPYALCLMPYA
jgi:hypothetical protein